MDYLKITITFTPGSDWLGDVLSAQMGETGFESFLETENGIEAFIPEKLYTEAELMNVLQPFREDFVLDVKLEKIGSRNWNEEWEKNYFQPLLVAEECVVRAPFHTDFPKAKYEIVIEPNMAFGTGNHETTCMMLEYILESEMEGKKVLDMGCGTGILGILASMKGAKEITAIDIDEWSYRGARENAELNKVKNMTVKQGDASLLGDEKFDYILANIHKNVLIADLQMYAKCLNPNGKVILSGFYTVDIPDINARALPEGLIDAGHKMKNNWVACTFIK